MNPQSNASSNSAPRRLSMDLSPRRATTPTSTPSAVAAPTPRPKPAAAMHSRVKPAHVLDLRQQAAAPLAGTNAPAATPVPVTEGQPVITPIARTTNHLPAPPPKTAAHERHTTQYHDRLSQAKQYERSPHIQKFSGKLAATGTATAALTPAPMPTSSAAVPAQTHVAAPPAAPPIAPSPELPRHIATQHEAMARLITPAAAPQTAAQPQPATTPKPAWRPHLKLSPNTGRLAATGTAIVIMAGYIWLQNYPKFALQAAAGKAGLQASLPGYIPSSYNLAGTDTAPGLVTLNFRSPSNPETLKIAQHRTSWDSSSLLDNFVSKNTDAYATVQGQGLTIYVWGNSQASWVNHGIWYSIEGASRLSREQLLKIAYSL